MICEENSWQWVLWMLIWLWQENIENMQRSYKECRYLQHRQSVKCNTHTLLALDRIPEMRQNTWIFRILNHIFVHPWRLCTKVHKCNEWMKEGLRLEFHNPTPKGTHSKLHKFLAKDKVWIYRTIKIQHTNFYHHQIGVHMPRPSGRSRERQQAAGWLSLISDWQAQQAH